MNPETTTQTDFRLASESKKPPKAAVDGAAGIIVANAEVFGTPDQTFRALMTSEVVALHFNRFFLTFVAGLVFRVVWSRGS